jgi:hypothetical protein
MPEYFMPPNHHEVLTQPGRNTWDFEMLLDSVFGLTEVEIYAPFPCINELLERMLPACKQA